MTKELDHIAEQIERIDRELQSLSDRKRALETQKESLSLRAIELLHGVTVGTIVICRGIEHRVTRIDARRGADRPWLEGNPRRRDGTFGTATRNLYDYWEKVS